MYASENKPILLSGEEWRAQRLLLKTHVKHK